jgi:hypothetical protein
MKVDVKRLEPICNKCGKLAPVDEKMSTPQWTVHRVKGPCECGGQFVARFMVEEQNRENP